jgi:hypothetical protein
MAIFLQKPRDDANDNISSESDNGCQNEDIFDHLFTGNGFAGVGFCSTSLITSVMTSSATFSKSGPPHPHKVIGNIRIYNHFLIHKPQSRVFMIYKILVLLALSSCSFKSWTYNHEPRVFECPDADPGVAKGANGPIQTHII